MGHKTNEMQIESGVIANDNFIFSGSATGDLWCWDLISAKVVNKFVHNPGKVLNSLSIHPKKDILLTSSVQTVKVWGHQEDLASTTE